MNLPERSNPEEYTTLEISVPKEDIEKITALAGIANAFNLPMRTRQALESDLTRTIQPEANVVNLNEFKTISEEVYGRPVYGEAAKARINDIKRTFKRRWHPEHHQRSEWERSYTDYEDLWKHYPNADLQYIRSSQLDFLRLTQEEQEHWMSVKDDWHLQMPIVFYPGHRDLTREKQLLEAAIDQIWPRSNYPFTAPTASQDPTYKERWILTPGDITRDRLAGMLRSIPDNPRSIPDARGKVLDVMNIRAGLLSVREAQQRVKSQPKEQYINRGLLLQAIADADINSSQKRWTRSVVQHSPYEREVGGTGPVAVEYSDSAKGLTPDLISLQGLQRVVSSYPGTESGMEFLGAYLKTLHSKLGSK